MAVLIGSSDQTGWTVSLPLNIGTTAAKRIFWQSFSCVSAGNVDTIKILFAGLLAGGVKALLADASGNVLAASSSVNSADGVVSFSIPSTAVTVGTNNYRIGWIHGGGDSEYQPVYSNAAITDWYPFDNTGNNFASNPPAATIAMDDTGNFNFLAWAEGGAGGSRTMTITLKDAANANLASKSLNWWLIPTEGGASVASGTNSTNASGVLTLTGLSPAAGSYVLVLKDPTDAQNSHNYPVTLT